MLKVRPMKTEYETNIHIHVSDYTYIITATTSLE